MGKTTGFLEYARIDEDYDPPAQRLKTWGEFTHVLSVEDAKVQGARCMDCGIPFCNNGCPVNNIIPDFNDMVFRDDWRVALDTLHSTNNFPEFTGRICPAPCESACTLGINDEPVGIKSIERAIIDRGWTEGWVAPMPPLRRTGKRVAVVGSGPAGLATAQQLARAGHAVTVFEKNDRVGGLLRYGIPDFKLDKRLIDRRLEQMQAEGVEFRTGVRIGTKDATIGVNDGSSETIAPDALVAEFDAVVLAGGSETPRDLPVQGRDLKGVHYAMEFLVPQNRINAGDKPKGAISAKGKHVVVIGGGDTGSDCVGTSNRHGAKSVTQFELMPQPPEHENKPMVWPYWPIRLRTSSSHEEGCDRDWAVTTKRVDGDAKGNAATLVASRVEWKDGKMSEVAGSEWEMPADLVLLAMGFTNPVASVLEGFGIERDPRGNARAATDGPTSYQTSVDKVFAAGDMRRGQSLVVWAIREGRQCARAVDEYLMGSTTLPR